MGVSCSCEGPSVVFPQHNLRVVRSKGQNRMSSPRGGGGGPAAEEDYANRPPTTHIFTQPAQISEDSTFLSFHHIGTAGSVVASNPPQQQQQHQHQQQTSASLNIPQQHPLGSDTDSLLLNTTGQLRYYASCASSFASGGSQRAIANQLDSRSSHTTTSYGGGIRNPLAPSVTHATRSQLLPSDPWSSLCSRTSSDLTAVRQTQTEVFAEENKQRMVPNVDEGNKCPSSASLLEESQEGPPRHLQLAVGMPTNQFTGDSSSMCCDSSLGSPYDTGVHPSDAFVGAPMQNNF